MIMCFKIEKELIMYRGFLDKCPFSDYMRDYLRTADLCPLNMIDIVMYAPIPIYTKFDELKKMRGDISDREDNYFVDYYNRAIRNIELGIRYLSEEGVFSIELVENDHENKATKYDLQMICGTLDAVMAFTRQDSEYRNDSPGYHFWYSVRKWIKDQEDKYVVACDYFIMKDEVLLSALGDGNGYIDRIDTFDSFEAQNLNIPVPFKAGDIMEFDCAPFGPRFHVLILKVGDNRDCCCVQGLAIHEKGEWSTGAVKHGMIECFGSHYPYISLLYSARLFEGELDDKERIMCEISEYIGGNESKGRAFWNALLSFENKTKGHKNSYTEEELKNQCRLLKI